MDRKPKPIKNTLGAGAYSIPSFKSPMRSILPQVVPQVTVKNLITTQGTSWGGLTCTTLLDCPAIIGFGSRITTNEWNVATLQNNINTLQSLVTQEQVQDWVAPMFTLWTHTWIAFAYNDALNTINATVNFPSQITITGQDEWLNVIAPVQTINFVWSGVTATNAGSGILQVTIPWGWPVADELVRVSATDTTSKYLSPSIANAITLNSLNDWTIAKRIENPGANELVRLSANLSTYTGDTNFIWNHTQTWNTVHNWNVLFTGTQTFSPTSVNNFQAGSVTNFLDNSAISVAGDVTRDNTSTQNYIPWSVVGWTQTQTNLTINGTNVDQTYDNTSSVLYNGTPITNNGNTITNTNITENYLDTPVLISCQAAPVPSFATNFTIPALTEFVEYSVSFDNWPAGTDTKVLRSIVNSATQAIVFTSWVDSGTLNVVWTSPTQITLNIVAWTPAFFTINSICYYNGVSVNNYTNKIHRHAGDMFNYDDTNNNFTNSNLTLDQNSTFVTEGDVQLLWTTTIENIVISWSVLVTQKVQASNTTGLYPIASEPGQIFKNGLFMSKGPTYDYVRNATLSRVEFNTATALTDFIVFL